MSYEARAGAVDAVRARAEGDVVRNTLIREGVGLLKDHAHALAQEVDVHAPIYFFAVELDSTPALYFDASSMRSFMRVERFEAAYFCRSPRGR